MELINSGDVIAILGRIGEPGIIGRSLAGCFGASPRFKEVEIYHGFDLDHVVQSEVCDSIIEASTVKVAIFDLSYSNAGLSALFDGSWQSLTPEEQQQSHETFDWIFEIKHSQGGFGPKLVGGKKCMDPTQHN